MSHAHPRRAGRTRPARARLRAALAITVAVCALEVAGGWWSGSLALLSDAGHMLADVFALVLSLMALTFAARPATPEKTYGYHRLEILAALANGVLLCLVAIAVVLEAWERFRAPRPVASGPLLAVATVGLAANLVSAALLSRAAHNLSVRSAYLHVLGDSLSSLGVIAGGLLVLATGESRIDAVVGAGIAGFVLWSAQRLVRDAADVLLESSPKGIAAREVNHAILETPGVVGLHDLHIWSLTTGVEALSAHVLVRPEDLPHTDRILSAINEALFARFRISHTTLQVESDPTEHACAMRE